jgi:hypothetical protein
LPRCAKCRLFSKFDHVDDRAALFVAQHGMSEKAVTIAL